MPQPYRTPGWRHVTEEQDRVEIGGLQVWKTPWRKAVPGEVFLPSPAYPHELHRFSIYEIGPVTSPIRFAATEMSNNCYAFYIPEGDWRYRVYDVIPDPGAGKLLLLKGTTDLPVGSRVSVKLEMPGEATIETLGIKEWEVGVESGRRDAFRLPELKLTPPEGSVAEVHLFAEP